MLFRSTKGAVSASLPRKKIHQQYHRDRTLHCSYYVTVAEDRAEFTLFRTKEDLEELLQEAEHLGFTKAVGLYQELKDL